MATKEKTFSSFTPEQAAAYAAGRGMSYPQPIYDSIFEYHADRPRETLLDVGTGPGKVVFDLLPHFQRGIGCDSSPGMIGQAQKDALQRNVADKTEFAVVRGEDLATAFADRQVDVLTVATAVHWFDMPTFYQAAAKVLKPGGTLALWTTSHVYVHPSVPNHKELQRILDHLERDVLGPFTIRGNVLARDAYEELPLPWSDAQTAGLFEEAAFKRVDWDRHGIPSAPSLPDGSPGPFVYDKETPIAILAAAMNSASPLIRWREAHPEKANTDEDCLKQTIAQLKEANGGKESFRMSPSCTILLFQRS